MLVKVIRGIDGLVQGRPFPPVGTVYEIDHPTVATCLIADGNVVAVAVPPVERAEKATAPAPEIRRGPGRPRKNPKD